MWRNKSKVSQPIVCVLLISLFLFSSCKKKTTGTKSSLQEQFSKVIHDAHLLPFVHRYDYFSFKAKLDYEDGKSGFQFVANFRIRQDSLIWISFTGPLNIEIARAVVSADSVRIWNRLTGERVSHSISFLNTYLPIDANFSLVQDFVLGNALAATRVACISDTVGDNIGFTQQDAKLKITHLCNMKYYTLSSLLLKDYMLNQQLDATFENYQKVDSNYFSCARSIQIQRGNQLVKIKADIYKYRAHELVEFPF